MCVNSADVVDGTKCPVEQVKESDGAGLGLAVRDMRADVQEGTRLAVEDERPSDGSAGVEKSETILRFEAHLVC
jgi:hypothetical protein